MPVVFSDNVTPGTHSEPPLFIKGDEIFRNGCNRGGGGGGGGEWKNFARNREGKAKKNEGRL